ncbi:hypothetical protein LJR009_003485 [Bosea sp. LjRoot9]|uniref:hypothetical protein n=1 Tax=Bosea sp. LjRoot9 TaxID=3342341 RepID=UPI003ECE077A
MDVSAVNGQAPKDAESCGAHRDTACGVGSVPPPEGARGGEQAPAAELERVRAEQRRHAERSELRRRLVSSSDLLSARLEQVLLELHETKQRMEEARRTTAGLRRVLYLRRMSFQRRLVRRLLPERLRLWWDERHLSGLERIIAESGLFDAAWYRQAYPEAAASGLEPIRDYLQFGAAKGRWPSPDFDPDRYASERPILAFLGLDPFVHSIVSGAQSETGQRANDPLKSDADAVLMARAQAREPLLEGSEPDGWFNGSWYGGRVLAEDERFAPRLVTPDDQLASDMRFHAATSELTRRYGIRPPAQTIEILRKAAPVELIRRAFAKTEPHRDARCSQAVPRYAIVTVRAGETEHFRSCAASVKALMGRDYEAVGVRRITWIVVGGVADLNSESALDLFPADMSAFVVELESASSHGAGGSLKEALLKAGAEWHFSLEEADEIEVHATAALDFYSAHFPRCRSILASPVDIAGDGEVLRRNRNASPDRLFESGLAPGQFVAVRCDLPLNREGEADDRAIDYEALLRVALDEPVLVIPEYLHRHRWLPASACKAAAANPSLSTARAMRGFLNLFAQQLAGQSDDRGAPLAGPLTAGLCIIRTQGSRLHLLAETVASVLDQTVSTRPCVVVHGGDDVEAQVRAWLASQQLDALVIGAPDRERRRGYPLNVGLDYVRANAGAYDFAFFLDDDDIIYPLYAERLAALLSRTGCDVGVALANSRVPWNPPQPGHQQLPVSALVAGNFIPIHCYAMRTAFLTANPLRFQEDIDYLEDWDFLVSLLDAGARFFLLPEVLCEYRIIGDGNQKEKRNQEHFEQCERMVLEKGLLTARRLGLKRFVRDLAAFDFEERAALSPAEVERLVEVRSIFESQMTENRR